jgi:hypothetical protein
MVISLSWFGKLLLALPSIVTVSKFCGTCDHTLLSHDSGVLLLSHRPDLLVKFMVGFGLFCSFQDFYMCFERGSVFGERRACLILVILHLLRGDSRRHSFTNCPSHTHVHPHTHKHVHSLSLGTVNCCCPSMLLMQQFSLKFIKLLAFVTHRLAFDVLKLELNHKLKILLLTFTKLQIQNTFDNFLY